MNSTKCHLQCHPGAHSGCSDAFRADRPAHGELRVSGFGFKKVRPEDRWNTQSQGLFSRVSFSLRIYIYIYVYIYIYIYG